MYNKLNRKELVSILWDIRDIPEYLNELSIPELKQVDSLLLDWYLEIYSVIMREFTESGHNPKIYEKLKNENLCNGFSAMDVEFLRNKIEEIIDPIGLKKFNTVLKKLSDGFNYKFPTTKYTIIYHFLNTEMKLMPISKENYYIHVRNGFDLKGREFKRLSFEDYTDDRYVNSVEELRQIMDI